jgi:hypothetical protein
MKDLSEKIHQVVANHFTAFEVIIDPDHENDVMYKLKLDKRMNVTGIAIFPKIIANVIKENFTIFERILYGKKIQDAAVLVLSSTISNLTKSRDCLESLANHIRTDIQTELEYEQLKPQLEATLAKLSNLVIPYQDRNKYLIQPNITVNLESKLPVIFSNIELNSFMNVIGYRPEKNSRGKVLPWQ